MAIPPLVLRIYADSTGVKAGVAQTQAQIGGLRSSISKNAGLIKGAIVAGVVVGLKESVDAAVEAQNAQLKLGNSLQNAAGFSSTAQEAFTAQADALRDLTGVDDEAIIGAQAFLIQMKLTEDQVKSLTPLIVDLSQKMGIDLETAAKAVGKSVNGTTGGLQRMGIIVDKTKAATDPYVATLEALGVAQGFAAKQAKNQPWKILGAQFEELLEIIGQALLPVIKTLANTLRFLLPIVRDLGPLLLAAAAGLAAMWTLGKIGTLAGALSATSTAMTGLGVASLTAAGPIGIIVGLIAGTVALERSSSSALERQTARYEALGYSAEQAGKMIDNQFNASIRRIPGDLRSANMAVYDHVTALENGGNAARAAGGQAEYYARTLEGEADASGKATKSAKELRQARLALAGGLLGLVTQLNTLNEAQDTVNRMQENGRRGTEAYKDAKLVLLQEIVASKDALLDYGQSLRDEGQTYPQVRAKLVALGEEYGLTRDEVLDVLGVIKDVNAEWAKTPKNVHTNYSIDLTGDVSGANSLGLNFGQRARGGPVSMGTPYIVGEAGPELFVPGSSGQIIPNEKLGTTGATIVFNGDVYGWDDFQAKVSQALAEQVRRAS